MHLTAPRLVLQLPHAASRLTYRRLRRPTPLPTMETQTPLSRYLARFGGLFGGRGAA